MSGGLNTELDDQSDHAIKDGDIDIMRSKMASLTQEASLEGCIQKNDTR